MKYVSQTFGICPPSSLLTTKKEIETWVTAASQYDNHEFDQALETFEQIANTAAILFNCGMINATLGQHEKAVSQERHHRTSGIL